MVLESETKCRKKELAASFRRPFSYQILTFEDVQVNLGVLLDVINHCDPIINDGPGLHSTKDVG